MQLCFAAKCCCPCPLSANSGQPVCRVCTICRYRVWKSGCPCAPHITIVLLLCDTKGNPIAGSQGAKGARHVFQKLSSTGPRTGDDGFSGQAESVRGILVAWHKRFDQSASPSSARWLNRQRCLSRVCQARAGSGYKTGLLRSTCDAVSTFPACKADASHHS